jgi:DNA-binding CsgD family transcriptional regulator
LSKKQSLTPRNPERPAVHQQSKLGFSALDSLAVGFMVIDAGRKLLFANATAGKVLAARRGLVERNGLLHAEDRTGDDALQRAVDQIALTGADNFPQGGSMLTLIRADARPLSLMILPLHGETLHTASAQPAVMIVIDDPENRPRPTAGALAELWGLTPAEARLTAALVFGERLDAYAAQNSISVQTAKTHLKRVFGKAGVTRQSDLIREVLMNPVLWLSAESSDRTNK